MHPNPHISLEYGKRNKWSFFAQLPDMGYDWVLFTLFGYRVRGVEINPQDCLEVKGLPPNVTDGSICNNAYIVNNEVCESETEAGIGEIVEGARFCTEYEAKCWVDSGESRLIDRGYRVTDPDAYGQSWASYEEFVDAVENAKKYKSQSTHRLKAFLAAMTSLREDGYTTRVVFWFEG